MNIKADIISLNAPLFEHTFASFKCESCGRLIENEDSAELCGGLTFRTPSCPDCGGKLKKMKPDKTKDMRKLY